MVRWSEFFGIAKDFQPRALESIHDHFSGDGRQLLEGDGVRIEEDNALICLVHSAMVLLEELSGEAAESVQLHAGNEFPVRELLTHGTYRGFQLGRGVRKIFIDSAIVILVH